MMKKSKKHGKERLVKDEMIYNLLKREQVAEFCLFAAWCGWRSVCTGPGEILHLEKEGRHVCIFYEGGEYVFFRRIHFPLLYAYTSGIAQEVFAEYIAN